MKLMFPIAYWRYKRAMFKYGIAIPYKTEIGYGFYIGHFGGIVVNSDVKIGNNVNISHGVTIGKSNNDGKRGCPTILDEVYIAPNCTVIGDIHIGTGSAIGANSFVNKDVLKGISVAGVPAKKISDNGSKDYIHNIWKKEKK